MSGRGRGRQSETPVVQRLTLAGAPQRRRCGLTGAWPLFAELPEFSLSWVPFPFPGTSPTLAAGAPESAFLGWKQGGGCGEQLMCD